ncbi:MAG: polyhydroxyalkanoic acid system family protein [Kofleriaceae bacterium]
MEIEYKHRLDEAEAQSRIKVLGEYLEKRHGIAVSWSAPDRAQFNGRYLVVKIRGEMVLGGGVVRFSGDDPGLLWRRKATEYIHSKLEKYLDPSVSLADLPRAS